MRLLRHSAAVIAAALLLAGCGGGGGGTSTAVPKPASSSGASAASPNRTPVGTASLTIRYSAHFHTAKVPKGKSTSGKSRKPAYVNSGAFYLDVWVVSDGSATHVVDSSVQGQNVTPSADGSQTLSIPLYSVSQNEVVAYESDLPYGSYGDVLSVGEDDAGSFTAGTAPQLALTMQMNALYLGVTSDPDNLNGDATIYSPYYSYNDICVTPATISPLYFFASDAQGGFVDLAGAGGVLNPTVASWTSDISGPANTLTAGSGVSGAYTVTINNGNINYGVDVHLSASNPAFPLAQDAENYNNNYPGLDYLVQTDTDDQLNSAMYYMYYDTNQLVTNAIDILPTDGC